MAVGFWHDDTGWSIVRFLHVLAAMGWVGGQLMSSVVVLPALVP